MQGFKKSYSSDFLIDIHSFNFIENKKHKELVVIYEDNYFQNH